MFFEIGRSGKNEWWMYILGFIIVMLGYTVGQAPLLIALVMSVNKDPDLELADLQNLQSDMDLTKYGIDSNTGFILLLLMFVIATLALYFVVKVIHQKDFKSIITPNTSINWSKIFFGFGLWFGMTLILECISYFTNADAYEFTLNISSFLPLLVIALLMLPIQTSFEEFLFRGYLMQGIGMISSHKWIPLLVTSLGFGAIHMANPEVLEFGVWTMLFYYVSAGLLLGVITVMDDGLELALGVHAATNIYGALMVGYNGSAIQTDTIFKTDNIDANFMIVVFLVSAVIFYMICSRKYNWKPITKIFEPISKKPLIDDEILL